MGKNITHRKKYYKRDLPAVGQDSCGDGDIAECDYGHLVLNSIPHSESIPPEFLEYETDPDIQSMLNDANQINRQISTRPTSEIAKELEEKAARSKAKKEACQYRRHRFRRNRAQLMLLMLESGMKYECNRPGCKESDFLTVDHIYPLSKGGSDELDNLQFLCQTHNSQKGDKS